MIRRLKSEVLSELPEKRRQKIEVSTDEAIVKQIKSILCRPARNSKNKEKRRFWLLLSLICIETLEERFKAMLDREDDKIDETNDRDNRGKSGFTLDEEEK